MSDKLTAKEWAAWVLMGDPYVKTPETLQPLAERIAQAVYQSRQEIINEAVTK